MSEIKEDLQAILAWTSINYSIAKYYELLYYCLGRYELLSIKFHFAYG